MAGTPHSSSATEPSARADRAARTRRASRGTSRSSSSSGSTNRNDVSSSGGRRTDRVAEPTAVVDEHDRLGAVGLRPLPFDAQQASDASARDRAPPGPPGSTWCEATRRPRPNRRETPSPACRSAPRAARGRDRPGSGPRPHPLRRSAVAPRHRVLGHRGSMPGDGPVPVRRSSTMPRRLCAAVSDRVGSSPRSRRPTSRASPRRDSPRVTGPRSDRWRGGSRGWWRCSVGSRCAAPRRSMSRSTDPRHVRAPSHHPVGERRRRPEVRRVRRSRATRPGRSRAWPGCRRDASGSSRRCAERRSAASRRRPRSRAGGAARAVQVGLVLGRRVDVDDEFDVVDVHPARRDIRRHEHAHADRRGSARGCGRARPARGCRAGRRRGCPRR